jgi:hypothetical protein
MPTPIQEPAKYVTPVAIGFADQSGNLALVSATTPLPTSGSSGGSDSATPTAPLAGQAASSTVVGPFVPGHRLPIHLQLSGSWTGSVSLQRSTDGGASRFPLTVAGQPWARFTGNANEVVWDESEDGASLWLDIALQSGTVQYRISQ